VTAGQGIVAAVAAVPALYSAWRTASIGYQDRWKPGVTTVVAFAVAAIVWLVLFFGLGLATGVL
jgi:hypothetical protein